LLSRWITNGLPGYQSFADWQIAKFGSTNAPNAAATADPDGDRAPNYLEYLTGTDPTNAASNWRISLVRTTNLAQVQFTEIANRGFEDQSTTNMSNSNSWAPLDVIGNEPFFSITNLPAVVSDALSNSTSRFYRVRVFEP